MAKGIDWGRLRDGIASGVGSAVNDIRHKYEEVFFGRQVTDTVGSIHANERAIEVKAPAVKAPEIKTPDIAAPDIEAPDAAAFRDRWAVKPPSVEREQTPEQEHDFDR